MYHELVTTDYLQVVFRDDNRLLIARWLRPTTLEETQTGYLAMLRAAEAQQCRRWLVDLRRRNMLPADALSWLYVTFFNQAAAQLGGQLSVAYLIAPTHLQHNDPDMTARFQAEGEVPAGRWRHFTDEGTANDWLAQQRPDPAG
jgi:hypothetical protein